MQTAINPPIECPKQLVLVNRKKIHTVRPIILWNSKTTVRLKFISPMNKKHNKCTVPHDLAIVVHYLKG